MPLGDMLWQACSERLFFVKGYPIRRVILCKMDFGENKNALQNESCRAFLLSCVTLPRLPNDFFLAVPYGNGWCFLFWSLGSPIKDINPWTPPAENQRKRPYFHCTVEIKYHIPWQSLFLPIGVVSILRGIRIPKTVSSFGKHTFRKKEGGEETGLGKGELSSRKFSFPHP